MEAESINRFNHRHALFELLLKAFLASIPLLLLILTYVHDDPFMIIYKYNDYSITKDANPTDRDFVSTEVFIRNYPEYKYDSFIFGSSRSLTFLCTEWKKYVKSSCFHFDASTESLYGIYKKITFLDRENVQIKNCLLVLDSGILGRTENEYNPLLIKHPALSQESWIKFHYLFLMNFLTNSYFVPFLAHKVNFTLPSSWGYSDIFIKYYIAWDPETNDLIFVDQENEIKYNREVYLKKFKLAFDAIDTSRGGFTGSVIGENELLQLKEIKAVFDKKNTDYKIIIYPAYDKVRFNRSDFKSLSDIFGENKIYDFSGRNEYDISPDNYYDSNHARAYVGNSILKRIYNP